MVEVMAERGIDCRGRPPIWAWHSDVRLWDAALLFDPQHELSRGFARMTFAAPAELVMVSDYGQWCEVLLLNATA